jgi:hypothetical protein
MMRNILLTIHIASVTSWLGADIVQYAIKPMQARESLEARTAWARVLVFLHARYYAVVVVFIVLSGVALVFESDWSWSSTFVWVGIGTVIAGGVGGGGGLQTLAKRRVAALESGDADGARRAERQALPIEIVLSVLVVVTILAMVSKWGA